MNRKYALPAAIALAAHALIFFVGSGKPPTPTLDEKLVVVKPPKPNKDDLYERAVQLVSNELKILAKSEDGEAGGAKKDDILAPPGMPDVPRGPVEINGPTQDYKPRITGTGDKVLPGMDGLGGDGDGSGKGRRILGAAMLDEPPSTRSTREPIYPASLKVSGTTGTVWVEFLVDENGRVHNVKVVKSTNRGFDEATLEAVSHWRFNSGKHKGLPVRFRMSVPVVFSLSD